jgi:hydroxymethylglutaryl-CoA reductase (NADPH)
VPIGRAGPLRIQGEHASGHFYIPLATSKGTLMASYNRGLRLLAECGGVKTMVVEQYAQRAPGFVLKARTSARFGHWVDQHFESIRKPAQATMRVGKLIGPK